MTELTEAVGARLEPWRLRMRQRFDVSMLFWALMIVVLLFLVVNPLLHLVLISFQETGTGAFTFKNYLTAYGRPRYVEALVTSLKLGVCVATLCTLLGTPIAWAVSRTDMPFKGLVRLTILATFIIPPYLGAIAWILLAGPNAGWFNRLYMFLTGAEHGIFNVYTFTGLVVVISFYSLPYVYIFISSGLDLISSEMEDAANILGAGKVRTTMRITLPLALPAIISAFVIVFLESIALFGTPALIALPARFHVVTTQLWQFFIFPIRAEVAAAYAMPLLAVTVLLYLVQKWLLRRKGFVTLTGKGGERREISLGIGRWVMFGYCMVVASLSVFIPLAVLLLAAFSTAWGRGFSWDNLTLNNMRYILFTQETTQTAIFNTYTYSAAAAVLAISVALSIAYIVHRRLVPMSGVLAILAMSPFVIPGVVLAIGFYAAYTTPPFMLYGTAWILIFAFATRFLPIAYANSHAMLRSINPEMEDAVRILGGTRVYAVRKVVAPMLKRSLAGAWLLIFIPATRELSAALFLYAPNTRVISVLLFDLSSEGVFEYLAALGLVLVVSSVALVVIGFKLIGRDFMLRRQ
jgi:iron(III) transport system permease protein